MYYVEKNVARSIYAESPYQPSRRMRGRMTTSCSRPFVGCPCGLYAWSICLHSYMYSHLYVFTPTYIHTWKGSLGYCLRVSKEELGNVKMHIPIQFLDVNMSPATGRDGYACMGPGSMYAVFTPDIHTWYSHLIFTPGSMYAVFTFIMHYWYSHLSMRISLYPAHWRQFLC